MISPWPAGAVTQKIEEGFVLFHVNGVTQHVGIAAASADFDAPVEVYAATAGFREAWNTPTGKRLSPWKVRVMGWVSHPQYVSETVRDQVLMCCDRMEKLLEGKPERRKKSCCWTLRESYRVVDDEDTDTVIFTGSCSGFVEYCYAKAVVDLVREGEALPWTQARLDEDFPIQREYGLAPDQKIRRLYPSYQIRALQKDIYPWEPDLTYCWYPENFEK